MDLESRSRRLIFPLAGADQMHLNYLSNVGVYVSELGPASFTLPFPETLPHTLILSYSCPCAHKSFSCTVPMKYPFPDICQWIFLSCKIKSGYNLDFI